MEESPGCPCDHCSVEPDDYPLTDPWEGPLPIASSRPTQNHGDFRASIRVLRYPWITQLSNRYLRLSLTGFHFSGIARTIRPLPCQLMTTA